MIVRSYETPIAKYTLHEIEGAEVWHCAFIHENHPVNIKWERAGRFLDEGVVDAPN